MSPIIHCMLLKRYGAMPTLNVSDYMTCMIGWNTSQPMTIRMMISLIWQNAWWLKDAIRRIETLWWGLLKTGSSVSSPLHLWTDPSVQASVKSNKYFQFSFAVFVTWHSQWCRKQQVCHLKCSNELYIHLEHVFQPNRLSYWSHCTMSTINIFVISIGAAAIVSRVHLGLWPSLWWITQ
jgi:hypothetical protein